MNSEPYNPTVTKATRTSADFILTEYAIRDDQMRVTSEVTERRDRTLPKDRRVAINTSASGSLTIDQAEAYVEMIRRAIEDAKCR